MSADDIFDAVLGGLSMAIFGLWMVTGVFPVRFEALAGGMVSGETPERKATRDTRSHTSSFETPQPIQFQQGGQTVSRQVHYLEKGSSILPPASISKEAAK